MDRVFLFTTLLILAGAPAGDVRADMVVSLQARGESGQAINGPVSAGTRVFVDVLVSADGTDNPLFNVRGLQFDVSASSEGVQVEGFEWRLEPAVSDDSAYLSRTDLPRPVTVFTLISRAEGLILDLTDTPTLVGTVELVLQDTGTLDLVSSDAESGSTGASFTVGFNPTMTFTIAAGNLQGGSLGFEVIGGSGGSGGAGGGGGTGGTDETPTDADGDGVPDSDGSDSTGSDPDDATNSNDNGSGEPSDDDDSDNVNDGMPGGGSDANDNNSGDEGDSSDEDNQDNDNDSNGPTLPRRGGLCGVGLLGMMPFWIFGFMLVRRPRIHGAFLTRIGRSR